MSIMPVSSMACGLQDSEVRLMVRAGVGPVSPPSFKAADVEMCRWAVGEIGALRDIHRPSVERLRIIERITKDPIAEMTGKLGGTK